VLSYPDIILKPEAVFTHNLPNEQEVSSLPGTPPLSGWWCNEALSCKIDDDDNDNNNNNNNNNNNRSLFTLLKTAAIFTVSVPLH
jgi:hypothetical protein